MQIDFDWALHIVLLSTFAHLLDQASVFEFCQTVIVITHSDDFIEMISSVKVYILYNGCISNRNESGENESRNLKSCIN